MDIALVTAEFSEPGNQVMVHSEEGMREAIVTVLPFEIENQAAL